jgi:CRP-like cAMP-binding protein
MDRRQHDLLQREAQVDALIAGGDNTGAIRLLLELIAAHAQQRAFAKAEALRERIYDIDPMALAEILKANELIETEQGRAIDPHRLSAFTSLTSALTPEELNLLYYALQDRHLAAGDILCRQGERMERLILVRGGELLLQFRRAEQPLEIATLSAGDIAAEDTVFNATLSTLEIKAQAASVVCTLEKSVVDGWQEQQPALFTKLQHFCRQRQLSFGSLSQRRINRRRHPRLELEGAIQFQLMDPQGQPLGKMLRGALVNIAAGGVAFIIKSSTPRGANLLLGRSLQTRFTLGAGRHQGRLLDPTGNVVGVIHALFNDYVIHLAFHSPLKADLLDGLKPAATVQNAS